MPRKASIPSSNFDGFCLAHYPSDEQVQRDVERWFSSAKAEFGFDPNLELGDTVFGGEDAARDVTARVIQRFNDPDVFVYTTLFYVEGIVG